VPNPSPAMPGLLLLPRLAGALGVSLVLCTPSVAVAAAATPQPAQVSSYYPTRELDVRPGILTRVEPAYPEAALRRGVSGKVVIRLYINEQGGVDRVESVRANPPGYFEQSAVRAFRTARFTPGKKGKLAVRTQMVIEVSFEAPAAAGAPR
jgi:periplasmic protein TonB